MTQSELVPLASNATIDSLMFSLTDLESKTDKIKVQIENLDFLIELLQQQIESYDKLGNAPAQLYGDLVFAEKTVSELRKELDTQSD